MENKNDVTKLAYELTYHRYLMNKDKAQNLYTELDVSEYVALHSIARIASEKGGVSKKTYLSALAEQLEITISNCSRMIKKLSDRGLVVWSHDGDGSEGTYVVITESGTKAMLYQEKILNDYYGRVIERFGYDNLIELLKLMENLEKIMDTEFKEKE